MAEIFDLAVTDGNNTGRFPEGQAPSTVNNGARALEGILARGFRDTIIPDRTTTGSANAQVLTPNETIAALAAGMSQTWKAGYTNTGAMTLNVAATGAKPVKMTNGADPYAGAVVAGGYYRTVYDGTNHILMNPSPLAQPGPASTTQSGIVELATDAETQSLSDATRAVTPSNLGALAASTTQRGIVELATNTETNTGTSNRVPDAAAMAATLFESAEITIADGAIGTWTHGIGAEAKVMEAWVRCKNAAGGWSVGDELPLCNWINATPQFVGVQLAKISATQVKYAIAVAGIYIGNGSTANYFKATNPDFKLFLRAKPY